MFHLPKISLALCLLVTFVISEGIAESTLAETAAKPIIETEATLQGPPQSLRSLPTEESVQRSEPPPETTSGVFDTKNGLTLNETLLVDGLVRRTIVHLPKHYKAGTKLPLVIVLHGAKLTGWIAQTATGFDKISNEEGFIVTYPDAIRRQWNDGRAFGDTPSFGINDVQFISTLIDYMVWKYQVDASKVYVAGYSSGGMLSYRLALELTDKVAAIATVAATFPVPQFERQEKPARPISVLMINGTADRAFPWNGGNTRIIRIKVGNVTPVLTTYDYWIAANGGPGETPQREEALQRKEGGTKVEFRNTRTASGKCVLLYKINGGGHTWPGSEVPLRYIPLLGIQSRSLNASGLIWEFFKNQDKDCNL